MRLEQWLCQLQLISLQTVSKEAKDGQRERKALLHPPSWGHKDCLGLCQGHSRGSGNRASPCPPMIGDYNEEEVNRSKGR